MAATPSCATARKSRSATAAANVARRNLVLLRPDRAAIGLRRRRADDARPRERRRWLRHQRPEGLHLRHGHQRLLPAGHAHLDRRRRNSRASPPSWSTPRRPASRSRRSKRSATAPSAPRRCSTPTCACRLPPCWARSTGWAAVDAYLWYERLCLSAARTGAALAAFDYALAYAKERKQFGKTIGSFQAISHKLADMKVMLDVSRMLVYRFAWAMAQGQGHAQRRRRAQALHRRDLQGGVRSSACRSSAATAIAWNIRCSASSATRGWRPSAAAPRKSSATSSRAGLGL